mmetsp:Transcript_25918/g.90245  ORF Transcript_25918/g.90245 Transcript_25918/m.90245 type:complete len:202 (-) Transcript_25918:155-760(-)
MLSLTFRMRLAARRRSGSPYASSSASPPPTSALLSPICPLSACSAARDAGPGDPGRRRFRRCCLSKRAAAPSLAALAAATARAPGVDDPRPRFRLDDVLGEPVITLSSSAPPAAPLPLPLPPPAAEPLPRRPPPRDDLDSSSVASDATLALDVGTRRRDGRPPPAPAPAPDPPDSSVAAAGARRSDMAGRPSRCTTVAAFP